MVVREICQVKEDIAHPGVFPIQNIQLISEQEIPVEQVVDRGAGCGMYSSTRLASFIWLISQSNFSGRLYTSAPWRSLCSCATRNGENTPGMPGMAWISFNTAPTRRVFRLLELFGGMGRPR